MKGLEGVSTHRIHGEGGEPGSQLASEPAFSCPGIPRPPQISRATSAGLLEVIFLYQRCWLM